MRIGFDAKRIFHNNTGLGNYSRDLVRILSKYYPQNQYFLYNPKNTESKLFALEAENILEIQPRSLFYKKFHALWRQLSIINDLRKDKIELYHGLSGELPLGIKSSGIKSVVTIHDLIFIRYPKLYSAIDRYIYCKKFLHAAKNADCVIAISEQTKADIIHYLGIESLKIKVLYQGCNAAFKQSISTEEKNKVSLKFALPPSFILNVGKIEERKNLLSLVKAIKNLDTHLVVVGGETTYKQKVKQYISENKLQHKVQFLKNVSTVELATLYQMASIFIYPSLFEGFGIPILEALYSKTPVITTKGGCFAEAGGEHSVYIDPLNVLELENAIRNLLENNDLRTEMAEKGFVYAQQFNDEVIAKKLMEIYKSV
jgi:glycosyltransferase involved in cell wall biosynthesis